jgi:hypothetical protein
VGIHYVEPHFGLAGSCVPMQGCRLRGSSAGNASAHSRSWAAELKLVTDEVALSPVLRSGQAVTMTICWCLAVHVAAHRRDSPVQRR